jgi:predicted GNAT family N-acyltransferase
VRFGEYIGTIRYVPMDQGLAPCETLVRRHHLAGALPDRSWEVGRLVLAPQYRSGPDALKRFLFLTLVDLLEEAHVENLFASCTPLLSRLYRRFGFSVVAREASHDGQGSYALIHGPVPEVLRALAASREERAQVERLLAQREALPC